LSILEEAWQEHLEPRVAGAPMPEPMTAKRLAEIKELNARYYGLSSWATKELIGEIERLQAEVDKLKAALEEAFPGAMWQSCRYRNLPAANPTWHCCDWSEWVKDVAALLGKQEALEGKDGENPSAS